VNLHNLKSIAMLIVWAVGSYFAVGYLSDNGIMKAGSAAALSLSALFAIFMAAKKFAGQR
jgi:hypothetical protein